MRHLSARIHACTYGLFKPHPRKVALTAYQDIETVLKLQGLDSDPKRHELAHRLMDGVLRRMTAPVSPEFEEIAKGYAEAIFAFEGWFELPKFDWQKSHSIADYWQLQDDLKRQRLLTENMDETIDLIGRAFFTAINIIHSAMPNLPSKSEYSSSITVPTNFLHAAT